MRAEARHGGALDRVRAAFPEAPQPWLDLSTGINPWSYPVAPVSDALLQHLPTQTAYEACREAMASAMSAPQEAICLAPGSELLIRLLPILLSCKRVAVLSPTYGDHALIWQRAGAEVIETQDPLAHTETADAIVLCNPNNPDGRLFDPDQLRRARETLAVRDAYLIVDEAYADLSPELSLAPSGGQDGLIILRSFGKFYGLAGLRFGAMLAPPSVRTDLSALLGVWPVSGAALEIGQRAYLDMIWQTSSRSRLADARGALDDALHSNGLRVLGGTDLFRYVEIVGAPAAWTHLAERGIYVRKFEDRDSVLRIGIPPDTAALDRLSEALSLLA